MKRYAYLAAAAAVASVLSLASNRAEACTDINTAANDIISAGTSVSSGAPFFTASVKKAFYSSLSTSTQNAYISYLWGSSSPSSAGYYGNIVAGTYFTRITDLSQIQAGDALVINAAGTYSGHTMIIRGAATQLPVPLSPQNPYGAATSADWPTQWVVPISDSTSSVHGNSTTYPDSRVDPATGIFTAGTGTAWIRIYRDVTTGALSGYTWAPSPGTYYDISTRPFAIGRVTPCPPL